MTFVNNMLPFVTVLIRSNSGDSLVHTTSIEAFNIDTEFNPMLLTVSATNILWTRAILRHQERGPMTVTQSVQVEKHWLQWLIAWLHSMFCTWNRAPSLRCAVMLFITLNPDDANRRQSLRFWSWTPHNWKAFTAYACCDSCKLKLYQRFSSGSTYSYTHLLILKIVSVELGNL